MAPLYQTWAFAVRHEHIRCCWCDTDRNTGRFIDLILSSQYSSLARSLTSFCGLKPIRQALWRQTAACILYFCKHLHCNPSRSYPCNRVGEVRCLPRYRNDDLLRRWAARPLSNRGKAKSARRQVTRGTCLGKRRRERKEPNIVASTDPRDRVGISSLFAAGRVAGGVQPTDRPHTPGPGPVHGAVLQTGPLFHGSARGTIARDGGACHAATGLFCV